jgi:methionyl-tRNA synthetase
MDINLADKEFVYREGNLIIGIPLGIIPNNPLYLESTIENFRFHDTLAEIWQKISWANSFINNRKPWDEAKNDPTEFLKTMTTVVAMIHDITWWLQPFMPKTSQRIFDIFGNSGEKEIPENYKFVIKKGEGLFPRLQ